MLTFAIEYIPKGLTHLRTTCDGMTVNYTAAQSEMMLPLLRVRREGRGSWHGTGSVWSEENRLRSNGEDDRAVSPKLRNHFPPSIMAAAGGGGGGEERRGGAEGHDRCQRGVMAMNSKSSWWHGCVWRHRHGRDRGARPGHAYIWPGRGTMPPDTVTDRLI